MSEHEHKWQGRTDAGTQSMSRYKCEVCGCWGWRTWSYRTDGKLNPIKAYSPPVFQPEHSWLRDHGDVALELGTERGYKEIEIERYGEIRSRRY